MAGYELGTILLLACYACATRCPVLTGHAATRRGGRGDPGTNSLSCYAFPMRCPAMLLTCYAVSGTDVGSATTR
eukprot:3382079-Rhodomonas_salina.2